MSSLNALDWKNIGRIGKSNLKTYPAEDETLSLKQTIRAQRMEEKN